MKKNIFIILLLCISYTSIAQSEYRYLSLRISSSHNIDANFSDPSYLFLQTPVGQMPLLQKAVEYQNKAHFHYGIGFSAGLLYHIDLKKDKLGFVLGVEYASNGWQAKYFTDNPSYWVLYQYRSSTIKFPLFLKFGKDVYRNQGYGFIGAQFNYNLSVTETQSVPWENKVFIHKLEAFHFNQSTVSGIVGFNFNVFNFELEYVLGGVLNTSYINTDKFSLYDHFPKHNLFIKAGFVFPFSRWLFMRSWTAEKFRRRILFR